MTEQDRLYEAILTTQDITCSNCRTTSTLHNIEGYEAAEEFQAIGWRATKSNNIYCPKCAKIKLKTRKQ